MSLEIRPMTTLDLPTLVAIERECFVIPWSETALTTELAKEAAVFLVAQMASEVAGYVGMNYVLDEGYITNVAVKQPFRRQGVAHALLTNLEARSQGIGLTFLSLEVRPSNTGAIALYTGLGFEQTGRRKNFYPIPREDALILTKWLK